MLASDTGAHRRILIGCQFGQALKDTLSDICGCIGAAYYIEHYAHWAVEATMKYKYTAAELTAAQGQNVRKRLEHLRGELRAERISYDELAELQSLSAYIDKDDVELLEAAG